MWQAIKNFLKRILPPPARAFNREIARILAAVEAARLESRQETQSLHQELLQSLAELNELRREQRQTLAEIKEIRREQTERFADYRDLARKHSDWLERQTDWLKQQTAMLDKLAQEHAQLMELRARQQEQMEVISKGQAAASEERRVGLLQLQQEIKRVKDAIPNQPIHWSNEFERNVVRANWGDVTQWPDFEEKFLKLISGLDSESIRKVIRILTRQNAYINNDKKSIDLFTRAEQEELRLLRENFNSEIFRISENLFAYRNYLLPVRHFEPSVFYFRHGLDEVTTLDGVAGKAIIDVGGFIGDSVLILSELNPSKIYTFEALPENFVLLKKTMELNQIRNVVAENVALAAEPGSLTLHAGGSCSTVIERPGLNYTADIEVPVLTLDDYVQQHQIQVGLIKVDIEGGEPLFLAGAKQTICEQKPILLLSIYHNAHDFFELKPLLESWNLGYTFHLHKPTMGNATSETLLIAESKS